MKFESSKHETELSMKLTAQVQALIGHVVSETGQTIHIMLYYRG